MSSTPVQSATGPRVLVFSAQALSFDEKALNQFRTVLVGSPELSWILATLSELVSNWNQITDAFPHLKALPAAKLLDDLNDWLKNGGTIPFSFPLPNVVLTPLVVITELSQYWTQLSSSDSGSREEVDLYSLLGPDVETVGLCTGFLSALAVSSSANSTQFRQYGGVVIRLALLIGALVDAQEHSRALGGNSKSFSVAWTTLESESNMKTIFERYPEVR